MITTRKTVLSFESVDEIYGVTTKMKPLQQYFQIVLFIEGLNGVVAFTVIG